MMTASLPEACRSPRYFRKPCKHKHTWLTGTGGNSDSVRDSTYTSVPNLLSLNSSGTAFGPIQTVKAGKNAQ